MSIDSSTATENVQGHATAAEIVIRDAYHHMVQTGSPERMNHMEFRGTCGKFDCLNSGSIPPVDL